MRCYQLERLQLEQFRNISNDVMEFAPGINCLFGENGHGKTNILEAIYLLFQKRSFRKNVGPSQWLGLNSHQKGLFINSVFKNGQDGRRQSLGLKIDHSGFQYFLNSSPLRAKDRFKAPIVLINPFDSFLFFDQASFRRRFMDQKIAPLNPPYQRALRQFHQALRQKNTFLSVGDPKSLRAIDDVLAPLIPTITGLRRDFTQKMNPLFQETYKGLFSSEDRVELSYRPSLDEHDPQKVARILGDSLLADRRRGYLTQGPHRDDWEVLFNGIESTSYGSMGQQKMSFLGLLFAYIEGFRYDESGFPIVLMDDISGELDKARWGRLVSYLEGREFQVIITTANESFRSRLELIDGVGRFTVRLGRVSRQ